MQSCLVVSTWTRRVWSFPRGHDVVYTPDNSGLPGIWLETTDMTLFTPPATVACLEISLEILTFRRVPSFTPPATIARLETTSCPRGNDQTALHEANWLPCYHFESTVFNHLLCYQFVLSILVYFF